MNQRDETEGLARFKDAEGSRVTAEGEPVHEDTEGYGRWLRTQGEAAHTEGEDTEGHGRWSRTQGEAARTEGEAIGTEADDTAEYRTEVFR